VLLRKNPLDLMGLLGFFSPYAGKSLKGPHDSSGAVPDHESIELASA
jgi:hypothetical protein